MALSLRGAFTSPSATEMYNARKQAEVVESEFNTSIEMMFESGAYESIEQARAVVIDMINRGPVSGLDVVLRLHTKIYNGASINMNSYGRYMSQSHLVIAMTNIPLLIEAAMDAYGSKELCDIEVANYINTAVSKANSVLIELGQA